jgi:hypothetical protein
MRLKRLLVLLVGIIVFLMIAYFIWTLNSVYPGSALLLVGVLAFFLQCAQRIHWNTTVVAVWLGISDFVDYVVR